MNNSSIESSAINSVKMALNDTGYIDVSNIKEGDKFPIWDGDILVYSSKEQRNNEAVRYKIPVQIKGTEAKIDKSLKYNIRVNDLKNYCKDGGVLYFVVMVDKEHSINNKVYYISLLPAYIKKILNNKGKQNKISVDLKKLPIDQKELVELIFNFGLNKVKQADCIPAEKYAPADFDEVYLYHETPFKRNPNDILLNFSGYMYGYKDNVPYPIEVQKGDISQITKASIKVSVNNIAYFNESELRRDINTTTLIINHNIEFTYGDNTINKCSFVFQGTISACIKSLQFLLEVHKYHYFYLDEYKQECYFDPVNINELESNLEFCKQLKTAFEKCGVYEDIELQVFSEADNRNANILINAFVNNQDIALKTNSEAYVLDIRILGKTITCLALRNKNGKYNFLKFPTKENITVEKNGNILEVFPILMLKRQHLMNSYNITLDSFLENVKKHSVSSAYLDITNEFSLELIAAYDETYKDTLLDTAEETFKWMEEVNTDKNSSIIYHINLLQCKIRKNKNLQKEDKDYLYALSDQSNEITYKYAAAVLLREKERADRYYEQLSEDEQKRIANYPIYNLWKKL